MLKKVEFIPVTETSRPFAEAAVTCGFDKLGYVEDEYFLTGEANIYTEGEKQSARVLYTGAPYTTRIIVRRPADKTKFSGNVVVEILNASARIDIDRMWVNSWKFFTRSGDVYVGITSKGHVVDSLKKFDPVRYAPINWDNPHPERPTPDWAAGDTRHFWFLPQFEAGLFWDALLDCADLLRSEEDGNPLKGWGERYLYLTGWSQSGGYIARYLASFHDPDHPAFDGILSAGSGAGAVGLNSYENRSFFGGPGMPSGSMIGTRQPTIAINTESENRNAFWVGDFDEPEFKFRTYQIACSSHDTKYNLLDYYGEDGLKALLEIGIDNGWHGVDGDPMDQPYEPIFNAAYHHLYHWVRDGIPAPHAPKIETYMAFEKSRNPMGGYLDNKVDAFGNCVGGIRTPASDLPTATYTSCSHTAEGDVIAMFGHVNPFSPEKLQALYGTLEHYRQLVTASADEMMAKGFLLPEDREELIETVTAQAAARGLK